MNDSVCYSHTINFVTRKIDINKMKSNKIVVLLNNVIQHISQNRAKELLSNYYLLAEMPYFRLLSNQIAFFQSQSSTFAAIEQLKRKIKTHGRHLHSYSFL